MSHNLDDPEFWLPPLLKKSEFLVSESNSGFSSPVDSSMGSAETESDEDEFLTELIRRLTNSTHLSHDLWRPKPNQGLLPCDKTNVSSPESTNCNEEVAKITTRLEQDYTSGYTHFWGQPQKPCINPVYSSTKNHAYHSNQPILYQPHQQNGRAVGLSPSAWPTLQQSQSYKQPLPVSWTNDAASFLSNNVPKLGCSGTGVFLPRPVAAIPSETPRKKQPVALKQRKAATHSQQRRNISRSSATTNNEIRLPQEWTY